MTQKRFGMNDYFGVGQTAYPPLILDRLSTQPESAWSFARRKSRRYGGPVGRIYRLADGVEADIYGMGRLGLVSPAAIRAFNGWNLLYRSAQFTSVWIASRSSVALTSGLPPAEIIPFSTNVYRVTSDSTPANTHRILQHAALAPSNVDGQVYTATVWLRKGNSNYAQLRINNANESAIRASTLLKFSDGTLTTTVGSAVSAPLDNGWFRVSLTGTMVAGDVRPALFIQLAADSNGTTSFDGTLGYNVDVAAAQLELAPSFSSYNHRVAYAAQNTLWSRVYDQMGAGRTFAQSNSDLMPIAARQGVPVTENGIQSAEFVAADARRMSVASSAGLYNFMHTTGGWAFGVSRTNDNTALKCLLRNTSSGVRAGFQLTRATTEQWTVGVGRLDVAGVATDGNSVNATTTDALTSDNCLIVCNIDPDNPTAGSRVNLWQDGDAKTISNVSTGTPFVEDAQSDLFLGSTSDGTGTWDGTISEVGLGQGSLADADRLIYEADALDLWSIA